MSFPIVVKLLEKKEYKKKNKNEITFLSKELGNKKIGVKQTKHCKSLSSK